MKAAHAWRLSLGLPGVSIAEDDAPMRSAMKEAYATAELIEMAYCAGVDVFGD